MLVEDLIHRFKLEKKRNPLHVNELLDYIQKVISMGNYLLLNIKSFFSN